MFQGHRSNLVKIGLFVGFVAVILILSAATSADGGGKWVPAASGAACPSTSSSAGCPENTTCSEWDVDGESVVACCIPSELMGTGNFGACYEMQ